MLVIIGPVRVLACHRAVARVATPATDEIARLGKGDLSGTILADTSPNPLPIRPNARPLLNSLHRASEAFGNKTPNYDECIILVIAIQIDLSYFATNFDEVVL